MRLLPTTLTAVLLLSSACPLALAQSHAGGAKRSRAMKSPSSQMSHHKKSSDMPVGGAPKHGLTEELTRLEHQPLSQSSVAPARSKQEPKAVALPKLGTEKKGKSSGIKASGHSPKRIMTTRRSSGSATGTPRVH